MICATVVANSPDTVDSFNQEEAMSLPQRVPPDAHHVGSVDATAQRLRADYVPVKSEPG